MTEKEILAQALVEVIDDLIASRVADPDGEWSMTREPKRKLEALILKVLGND